MRKRTAPGASFTIAAAAIAVLIGVVATGFGGSHDESSSVSVSFSGVGPVKLLMSVKDARKAAGGGSAGFIEPDASAYFGTMVMCAGKTRGVAYFPVDKLEAIWLLSGAKTDRGIGIGSTRSEVKRAYGKALRHETENSFYIIGPKQSNYTPDIVFVFGPTPRSKVDLLGLVVRGAAVSSVRPSQVFC